MLESDHVPIVSASYIYKTEPWGNPNQPDFYNQAVLLSSDLDPERLLSRIHQIEEECGRKRLSERFTPRTIDIDILFYNNLILTTNDLKIPHPLLHRRLFVLIPMADIAPEFQHPVFGKTITELIKECDDETRISRIS